MTIDRERRPEWEQSPFGRRLVALVRMATARKFSGTSNKGDFEEALLQAFKAALTGLKTEIINWKLLKVHGVYGGIRPQNDLTAEIEASAP